MKIPKKISKKKLIEKYNILMNMDDPSIKDVQEFRFYLLTYMENENEKRRQQDRKIKQLLYEIQDKKCKHDWTYHRDPSGGSDSFYECDFCGKEKKY